MPHLIHVQEKRDPNTAKETEKQIPMPAHEHKKSFIHSLADKEVRTELFEVMLKIIRTPYIPLKAYLLIFILGTSGLAAYTVIESFMSYLAFDVTTKSRTVLETPTLYPKVTVCNLNIYTTEYAYNFLKSIDTNGFFERMALSNLTAKESLYLISDLYSRAQIIAYSQNISDQQRKLFAHRLDDMLINCRFNQMPCNASDFAWTFDQAYGNCYVFNSGYNAAGEKIALKELTLDSSYFGLQLEVYSNVYESLEVSNALFGGLGLVLRIENSSHLIGKKDDGVRIATGFHTDIVVDRSFKFMLPRPYSDCEVESDSSKTSGTDIFTLIAQSEYEYTQQLCFLQCYQKYLILECNCTNGMLSLYNVSSCVTNEEINCSSRFFVSSSRLFGDIYVMNIRENKNLSVDFVTKPLNVETARDSIASIIIYYHSLSYTISTESPQLDLIGLLAAIGGNLGLFMGVSFLGVSECVEILIEICFRKLNLKRIFTI